MASMSSPACVAANVAISQLPKWAEKKMKRVSGLRASRNSRTPSNATRLPGSYGLNLSRCGYSATTRPRLSHTPCTMRLMSESERLGRARRRLSRARLLMPSTGPMLRARKPPTADAASTGKIRKKAKTSRANSPSVQSRTRLTPSRSAMRRPFKRAVEQPVERRFVAPGDSQRQILDARSPRRREAHPVFFGGHQRRARFLRRVGERLQFGLAVRMMVGKAARRNDPRAGLGKMVEKLLRPADAGEQHEGPAGELRRWYQRFGL